MKNARNVTQDNIVDILREMNSNGLRIGQIMSNLFYNISKDGTDPFYIEDDKLLEQLKEYATN